MKPEDGSVYATLKEWLPTVRFSAQDTTKCYRMIEIDHPEIKGITAKLHIRTFDQAAVKHAGSNVDRILVNEPAPQSVWSETVGRTRAKKGDFEKTIAMFATCVTDAPYVVELSELPENIHVSGAIYENCVNEEVTDEMAEKVRLRTGTILKRSQYGGYITHGFLTRRSIENMISAWGAVSQAELDAREFGKLVDMQGRIFEEIYPDVHLCENDLFDDAPESYPVIQVVDPHSQRPDFSLWVKVFPGKRMIVGMEDPTPDLCGGKTFEQVKTRDVNDDVENTVQRWEKIEARYGQTKAMAVTLGDPNRFKEKQVGSKNVELQDLYRQHGRRIVTDVADDWDIGIKTIRKYLKFNRLMWETNKNDPQAWPMLMVTQRCKNVWQHLQRFGWKKNHDPDAAISEKIDEKYACVVACIK
jgi:hypothetical protein